MKHRPVSLLLCLAFFRVHLFLSPDLYLHIACKQSLVQTKRFEIRLSLLFSSFWPKCIHLHFKYWDNASEETSYILKAKENFHVFFLAWIRTLSAPRSITKMTTTTTPMWLMNLKIHRVKEARPLHFPSLQVK